jgi:hypothetical protein
MYSLTVKPFFFVPQLQFVSSSSSSSASYCLPRWSSLINFPTVRTKSRGRSFALRIQAYDSSKNDASNDSADSKPPNGTLVSLSLSTSLDIHFVFVVYIYIYIYIFCNVSDFFGLDRIMLLLYGRTARRVLRKIN